MDFPAKQRRKAHMHSAIEHDRTAEFHRALSEFFQSRGEHAQATWASELAAEQGRRALQEWAHAGLARAMRAPAA